MPRVHNAIGEHSRFRRSSLYLFARYLEMPFLAFAYQLLRGRYRHLGEKRVVRGILGWLVAAPFGYAGDTARPMPASAVLSLIDGLSGPIGVGPCRCRTAHAGCEHPTDTDIVIKTGVSAWTQAFPRDYRLIGKQEARSIASAAIGSACGRWSSSIVQCRHTRQAVHREPIRHLQLRPLWLRTLSSES